MTIPRLRALGVLAVTAAIVVTALAAPAGASAAIATGKLDATVNTVGSTGSGILAGGPPGVRKVDALLRTVGIGRVVTQVKLALVDTHLDLKGPCYPTISVAFFDKDGKLYSSTKSYDESGQPIPGTGGWVATGSFGGGCKKLYLPLTGPPVLPLPVFPFGVPVRAAEPSAHPLGLLPFVANTFVAKPGTVCATLSTSFAGTGTKSAPLCATIG